MPRRVPPLAGNGLERGQHLAYIRDWPPAQQQARRALHQALQDSIDVEKMVRATRRERPPKPRFVDLKPSAHPAKHRGGGLVD